MTVWRKRAFSISKFSRLNVLSIALSLHFLEPAGIIQSLDIGISPHAAKLAIGFEGMLEHPMASAGLHALDGSGVSRGIHHLPGLLGVADLHRGVGYDL